MWWTFISLIVLDFTFVHNIQKPALHEYSIVIWRNFLHCWEKFCPYNSLRLIKYKSDMPIASRTFYKECSPTTSYLSCFKISSVQSFGRVQLVAVPWNEVCQVSLSFTISQSLLKLMAIESVMLSNHLVLCHHLLLPSIFPSIRVFSNEMALLIRWPK